MSVTLKASLRESLNLPGSQITLFHLYPTGILSTTVESMARMRMQDWKSLSIASILYQVAQHEIGPNGFWSWSGIIQILKKISSILCSAGHGQVEFEDVNRQRKFE